MRVPITRDQHDYLRRIGISESDLPDFVENPPAPPRSSKPPAPPVEYVTTTGAAAVPSPVAPVRTRPRSRAGISAMPLRRAFMSNPDRRLATVFAIIFFITLLIALISKSWR